MKNKFLILIGTIIIILVAIIIIFSIIGNNKEEYLKEINYIEYVEKVHNNESFILYVKQTDCPHCIKFTPKFNTILDKYEIEAFVINLTELDETEKDLFIKDLSVSSTPTILFFENGIELGSFSRIIGVQSEKYIINKLKQHGYIKEFFTTLKSVKTKYNEFAETIDQESAKEKLREINDELLNINKNLNENSDEDTIEIQSDIRLGILSLISEGFTDDVEIGDDQSHTLAYAVEKLCKQINEDTSCKLN